MYFPKCAIGEELIGLTQGAVALNEDLAKPIDERNPEVGATFLAGMRILGAKVLMNGDNSKIVACVLDCRHCVGEAVIELSEPLVTIYPAENCPEARTEYSVIGELGGDEPTTTSQ